MSERSDFEVVETRSGARAVLDRTSGELMHPVVGPLREADELYVRASRLGARLDEARNGTFTLFDVGLGAGSNAIAAWTLSEGRTVSSSTLRIVSFDRTASALALALSPEHAESFGFVGAARDAALRLLESGRDASHQTTWRLSLGELPETLLVEEPDSADVVFWDPFSPRANPNLWTVSAFSALRRCCRLGATVHTYSGATATRTALLLAGFAVGFGKQLGSGRQATVAATRHEDLERPLDRRWLERLTRSSAPFPPDAPPAPFERVASMPQFA